VYCSVTERARNLTDWGVDLHGQDPGNTRIEHLSSDVTPTAIDATVLVAHEWVSPLWIISEMDSESVTAAYNSARLRTSPNS